MPFGMFRAESASRIYIHFLNAELRTLGFVSLKFPAILGNQAFRSCFQMIFAFLSLIKRQVYVKIWLRYINTGLNRHLEDASTFLFVGCLHRKGLNC